MRALAPYAGIALAVAVGIVAAPYLGWIVFWTVGALAFCIACALVRRAYRRGMRVIRR
jgi:hypothetical protein